YHAAPIPTAAATSTAGLRRRTPPTAREPVFAAPSAMPACSHLPAPSGRVWRTLSPTWPTRSIIFPEIESSLLMGESWAGSRSWPSLRPPPSPRRDALRRDDLPPAPIPAFPRKRGKEQGLRAASVAPDTPSPARGGGPGWGPHPSLRQVSSLRNLPPSQPSPASGGRSRDRASVAPTPLPACGEGTRG